jgi:2-oxo-4-hydroxy-4-carboxy-5-ureidoimidazoline decarboxylase
MQLEDLNAMDADSAEEALIRCCGSSRWARGVAASRPFTSPASLAEAAERLFDTLDAADWLEAFAAHPKIGAGGSGRAVESGESGGGTEKWSAEEQALVAQSADTTRQRLADANRDYEARFGYIFILCATGKTGGMMLELLEQRLENDPQRELRVAANEQRKITQLRLVKLLDDGRDKNR